MKFLRGLKLLILAGFGQGVLGSTNGTFTGFDFTEEGDPGLHTSGGELCHNLIVGGDAETGLISDWDPINSGSIAYDPDAAFGSTR